MTVPAWAIALFMTPVLGLLAFFVRMTTIDAIKQLRSSAEKQGRRIGQAEKMLAVVLRELETKEPAARRRRNTLLELQRQLDTSDDDESGDK